MCVWEDCDLRHDSLSAKPMARERDKERDSDRERKQCACAACVRLKHAGGMKDRLD